MPDEAMFEKWRRDRSRLDPSAGFADPVLEEIQLLPLPLEDPAILLEPERVRLVIQAGRVVGGTRSAPSDIRP